MERAQGPGLVGRGAGRSGPGTTSPTSRPTRRPTTGRPTDATGPAALSGIDPFIMQADGKAWLYVPAGLVDGPLPTHYEPQDSPFRNLLYAPAAEPSPAGAAVRPSAQPVPAEHGQPGSDVFPYVATTYRLTEHHTAGGMSRWLPYLAELQPEFFCEVSPELAAERGLEHLGWATIVTARNAIEARVLVTERMTPLTVQGRRLHQVGLPYHWGPNGYSTGDAANELVAISLDPNVHIQEVKAFACDIRPGRRPARPGPPRAGAGVPAAGRDHRADGNGAMTAMDVRDRPGSGHADAPTGRRQPPATTQPRMGFFTDTRCASAARPARWRARSGTTSPRTG